MKLLITGGAGFIGSAVIRYIINNTDVEVVNVDKLTYAGNLENLISLESSPRYRFERVDICDLPALERVFSKHKPDLVMHLAAESHVDRSIEGPSDFILTNILGTYNLLEVSRSYFDSLDDVRKNQFRFHHVSTDEVYGDLPHPDTTPSAHNQLFTEETPYAPSSPYSASKASSDHLVRAWGRTFNLPVVVSNCSNNYGPNQYPEKLIPVVILNALEGKDIPVYGEGRQIRDWLYVDDHAKALYQVLACGEIGQTYNIGGCNEKMNLEVVTTICHILQRIKPSDTSYDGLIRHINDRPGHDFRYAIDSSKVIKELGWAPQESFESGMEKTVQWYLDNLDWCERIRTGEYRQDLNEEDEL